MWRLTLVPALNARSLLAELAGMLRISAASFLRMTNDPLFSFHHFRGSSQSASGMLRYLSISMSVREDTGGGSEVSARRILRATSPARATSQARPGPRRAWWRPPPPRRTGRGRDPAWRSGRTAAPPSPARRRRRRRFHCQEDGRGRGTPAPTALRTSDARHTSRSTTKPAILESDTIVTSVLLTAPPSQPSRGTKRSNTEEPSPSKVKYVVDSCYCANVNKILIYRDPFVVWFEAWNKFLPSLSTKS